MMRRTKDTGTSTLLQTLFKAQSVETFFAENDGELGTIPFHQYITDLCFEKNLVPEHVITQSMIERTYGHQLFNGRRMPSRDKVLQLAFGFALNLEETQNLLKAAQKSSLYPRIRRDAAVMFCINRKVGIMETQELLSDLELTLLGGEEKHG